MLNSIKGMHHSVMIQAFYMNILIPITEQYLFSGYYGLCIWKCIGIPGESLFRRLTNVEDEIELYNKF